MPLLERAPGTAEGKLRVQGHSRSLSVLPLHRGEGAATNMASSGVT